MGHIKNLRIKGFKKFTDFIVNFNKNTNILVGENEAGKSTIIEALDVLINKLYENFDRYVLGELFNANDVALFKEQPSFENLPKIIICGEFELNATDKNSSYYYGLNWYGSDKKTFKYGITFECTVENDMKADVADIINRGIIPFEYYTLKWLTFKNETYNKLKKAITFVPIDSSNNTSFNSFDFYAKRLFLKKHEEKLPLVKTDFRTFIDENFAKLDLEKLDKNKKFGLNHKKMILENIIGISDSGILIENRGKGLEKIIKTELAIESKNDNDVIAIEEPENHLSHSNLKKMIYDIEEKCKDKQLIITTHNSLIVSGLDLKNVIWITKDSKKSLSELKPEVSAYFMKLENDNLLRFILANKVILVEGPTEKLIIANLFAMEYAATDQSTLESKGIDVISCNGLSYKKYLEIANVLNKKVAVLTDNDGSEEKISEISDYNKSNNNSKIFTPDSREEYTWEVSLKKENSTLIDEIVELKPGAKYEVSGRELGDKKLAYMILNKVDISLRLVNSKKEINRPKHLKELFKWIKE